MTITLLKKFTLDGITFCTIKYPIPYYEYIVLLFDAQFGNKSIPKEDLIGEGTIVDQSDYNYKQINSYVINLSHNFITVHIKDAVHSNGNDFQNKMNKVELMSIWKLEGFVLLYYELPMMILILLILSIILQKINAPNQMLLFIWILPNYILFK